LRRGGYVLSDAPNGKPELILLASGSEVHLRRTPRRFRAVRGVASRIRLLCGQRLRPRQGPPGPVLFRRTRNHTQELNP
jgi:transketolase